jgi:hypothetical protein
MSRQYQILRPNKFFPNSLLVWDCHFASVKSKTRRREEEMVTCVVSNGVDPLDLPHERWKTHIPHRLLPLNLCVDASAYQ